MLGLGLDPDHDRAKTQRRTDRQAARQEVEALRARQAQPKGDCSLEEAALASCP